MIPRIDKTTSNILTPNTNELIEQINDLTMLFKNLFVIQNHFETYFVLPDEIITEDKENLNEALKVVYNKKDKLNKIDFNLDRNKVSNTLLEDDTFPFKILFETPTEIEIFGNKINLGYNFVESLDGYLSNKEDVLEKIEEGCKLVNLVIKSRTNEMYLRYQNERKAEENS